MCEFSAYVAFDILLALVISKLDLCEGRLGRFSTAIFNSDIQLSVRAHFRALYVFFRFVALLKATYAENSNIALSCLQFFLKSVHVQPLMCFDLFS